MPTALDPNGAPAPAHYSPDEIAYILKQVGFTGDALATMVAVVLAESGGSNGAVGDGGNSVSMFQIYMPAHPNYDRARLQTDPLYAAQAAWEISGHGTNFNPWTTYSGATAAGRANSYKTHLSEAQAATQKVEQGYVPTNTAIASGTVTTAAAATSAQASDALAPDSTPEQVEAYIKSHYPDVAPFLGDEAIKWILYDAALRGKDATEIEAAIRQTEYWRTHGPASRAFDLLLAKDEHAAHEEINRVRILVDQAYQRQGVTKTHQDLDEVTLAYIRGGWTDADLERYVANELKKGVQNGQGVPVGESADTANQIIALARSYGLPLDEKGAQQFALDISAGRETMEGVRAKMVAFAKSRWQNDPDVLKAIDHGETVSSHFTFHANTIASILELNPASIDLINDPKYAGITSYYDPTTKEKRSMTLGEVADWARHQDEFKNTRQYKQQDAELTTSLLREFGAIA